MGTLQDLDNTLDMLIDAGARYDRRQLGPAGMKAWEVRVYSRNPLTTNMRI